ncbi:hypothetical protein [Desulfoferula mesophila]|uniref:Uncharacterized protein n=1 Tax=Desulfoferula mesophila TaxID=3058419 RepID=A0AAU9EJJ9_9BACT|nr:hypothetical protein FAK_32410 [Desulfoferula mesophilus]
MGTKYLTCVVKAGEYKIAQFGRSDGYPQGAGTKILKFLKRVDLTTFAENVSQLCFYTDEESVQINKEVGSYMGSIQGEKWDAIRKEDNKRYRNPTTELNDKYFSQPYIHVQSKLGWEILELIMRGNTPPLDNNVKFAGDSLFCEWVYVIDLDENQLEVYRGFNKEPVPEGERFANFEGEQPGDFEWRDSYYPVKHMVTFELDRLPSEEDFLERCSESQ